MAELDVAEQIGTARRVLRHLAERRPDSYRPGPARPGGPGGTGGAQRAKDKEDR